MRYPSLRIPLQQPDPREPPCAPNADSKHGSSGGPLAAQRSTSPRPRHLPLPVSDPIPEELSLLLRLAVRLSPQEPPPGLSCISHLLGSRRCGKNATWIIWCIVTLATRGCRGRHRHAHLTDEEIERVPRIPSRPLHVTLSLFKSKAWASQNFLCCPDLFSKAEREAQGPLFCCRVCLEIRVFLLLAIMGHKKACPFPINKPILFYRLCKTLKH